MNKHKLFKNPSWSLQKFINAKVRDAQHRMHGFEDTAVITHELINCVIAQLAGSTSCRLCGCTMSFEQDALGWGLQHPSNVSIDCIIPRCQGGTYTASNVQLLCSGCNQVKWCWTIHESRELIETLRATEMAFEDDMLCRSAIDATVPTPQEHHQILEWARRQVTYKKSNYKRTIEANANGANLKPKPVNFTVAQVAGLIASNWAGDGKVYDATGGAYRLRFIELDRIDSNLGYDIANVRPLLGGLNRLKKDEETDTAIRKYKVQVHEAA